MAVGSNPLDLIGLEADERLLGGDVAALPGSVGEPPAELPESAARRHVVRTGATLTGVSLVGGLALGLLGLIELLSEGGVLWFLVLIVGVVLVTTHWGWVHVAELAGNRIQGHRSAASDAARRDWLRGLEPYPRWEVTTIAGDDGSITILTTCHRPQRCSDRTFSFAREEVDREIHSGEEPAAVVSERAELLRRQAAADTAAAREEYAVAREAYEQALLTRDDEEQRTAALRAASQALAERINANLRDPPLVE
jgi:hypothetical protein